jgi:hypothetical protein
MSMIQTAEGTWGFQEQVVVYCLGDCPRLLDEVSKFCELESFLRNLNRNEKATSVYSQKKSQIPGSQVDYAGAKVCLFFASSDLALLKHDIVI